MSPDEIAERRLKPRISGPIAAVLIGTDRRGESFKIETALDNLSVGGLHAQIERQVEVKSLLFALIRFAGMEVEASGVVCRVESQPDGMFGLGVAFESYQVLGG